jgi:hypothetical protein
MSAEGLPTKGTSIFRVHPVEDLLEEYAFGRVAEPLLGRLEEHLLGCAACQQRMHDIEEYVAAMKEGAAILEAREAEVAASAAGARGVNSRVEEGPDEAGWLPKILRPFRLPAIAWAAAAVVVLLALIGYWRATQRPLPITPAVVTLTALRGTENSAEAPAGRSITLQIDANRLTDTQGSMSLHIVNETGQEVWSGIPQTDVAPENGHPRLTATVSASLQAGQYWVRLSSADQTLLREFGLRVR